VANPVHRVLDAARPQHLAAVVRIRQKARAGRRNRLKAPKRRVDLVVDVFRRRRFDVFRRFVVDGVGTVLSVGKHPLYLFLNGRPGFNVQNPFFICRSDITPQ
jgi:hypothetical protein